ncbi:MAG TPA: glycosyltransferase [Dehalococcoidia bacterium]|nr:glycosyltransferase [Dehalococcoidia bacterium]
MKVRLVRILTWHVHGNYLYYLTQSRHEFLLPVTAERKHPYGGRSDSFGFGSNVREANVEEVPDCDFDCVLYQSRSNYEDGLQLLSDTQQRLPALVLEHDPPREHPTDTRHWAADTGATIVHVTPFNALMWDNSDAEVRVVEHGVLLPKDVSYSGEIARGLVAVNNLPLRGRRLGLDVFERLRRDVPLDLVGMGSEAVGGLGEVQPSEFPAFAAHYRFMFNPIRYTSLGLAVCEALTIGLPVAGLATTEMARVIENGVTGYVDTDPEALIPHMRRLLDDPEHARRLGANAREGALRRFGIERFCADWDCVFEEAVGSKRSKAPAGIGATP